MNNTLSSPAAGPEWLPRRLEAAAGLEDNWDALGGLPVEHGALQAALSILPAYVPPDSYPASVRPSGDGGVMLEWLPSDRLVEVHIYADRRSEVLVLNRVAQTAVTGSLEENGDLVRQSIVEFSEEAHGNGLSPEDF